MTQWKKIHHILTQPWVFLVIRLCVGGVFLAFGIVKAIEPHATFFQNISDYRMLPESIIPYFGIAIICVEIIVGMLFLFGIFSRHAAWAITGLLVMFIIAIAQAQVRGIYLSDCGCTSSLITLGDTPRQVLVRDLVLLGAMAWYLAHRAQSMAWTIDNKLSPSLHEDRDRLDV